MLCDMLNDDLLPIHFQPTHASPLSSDAIRMSIRVRLGLIMNLQGGRRDAIAMIADQWVTILLATLVVEDVRIPIFLCKSAQIKACMAGLM